MAGRLKSPTVLAKTERGGAQLREAQEELAATAEILRAISSSRNDARLVFEAIVKAATRLGGARGATLLTYDGEKLRREANSEGFHSRAAAFIPDRGSLAGRVVLEGAAVEVPHFAKDSEYDSGAHRYGVAAVTRDIRDSHGIGVPLLRDGATVGVLNVFWPGAGSVPEKYKRVLRTFAEHAVVAIEHVRLHRDLEDRKRDLAEAFAQQTATADVLREMSRSMNDVQPVIDAIVASCSALFPGCQVTLRLVQGGMLRQSASAGPLPNPRPGELPLDRSTGVGTAILESRIVHVPDLRSVINIYPRAQYVLDAGLKSALSIPLTIHGASIGGISVNSPRIGSFTDREISTLKTFADQAVIAIENVRLFRELEERNRELAEALGQQTATAQILRAISSFPTDVQPVFDAIVRAAAKVGGASHAVMTRFDGTRLNLAAHTLAKCHDVEAFLPTRASLSGRVILEGKAVQVHHLSEDREYDTAKHTLQPNKDLHGIGVPMLRDGDPVGVLNVWWPGAGTVPGQYVTLLRTFAAQAVIAIENARLFNETKEALRQQTATNEILAAIGNSLTRVTPVFQKILEKAITLCDAQMAILGRYDGERYEHLSRIGATTEEFEKWLFRGPFVPDPGSAIERLVRRGMPFQILDARDSAMYAARIPMAVMMVEVGGARTYLAVPMIKDGKVVGGLIVYRREVREFTQQQIDLLSSFASQAVIAFENARLFGEIQEKSRQLESANKHKSDFLANMSHELRTPLNAIIGFSDVMLNGMAGELGAEQREFTTDIRDSGRHLLTLISDILDLSKIEAGRMDLDSARFDLPTAMRDSMTLLQGRAERHGIRLHTHISPTVGDYHGDERRFKQIVINLLTNAVKFTPMGGAVTLTAKRVNGAYRISVKDTGIGIAAEDQERIFEEFTQVGTDYARNAEGSGLGLALTRKLVHLHGGRISVRSEPGRGSKFTFTLPLEV